MTAEAPFRRNAQFVRAVVKPIADMTRLNAKATLRTRRLGHTGYTGAVITDYGPLNHQTSPQPYDAHHRRLHETRRVHHSPKRSTWAGAAAGRPSLKLVTVADLLAATRAHSEV